MTVDEKVKARLTNGSNDESVLVEMLELMPAIKSLLDSVPKKEIERVCYEYEGFYRYIKILENLAQGIADGQITVPD